AMSTAKWLIPANVNSAQLLMPYSKLTSGTMIQDLPQPMDSGFYHSTMFDVGSNQPLIPEKGMSVGCGGWRHSLAVASVEYQTVRVEPIANFTNQLFYRPAFAINEQFAIAEVSETLWSEKPRFFPLQQEAA